MAPKAATGKAPRTRTANYFAQLRRRPSAPCRTRVFRKHLIYERTIGNRAVAHFLQIRPRADRHEQYAARMAQEALRVPDSAQRMDPKASPSRIGQQAAAGLGGGEPLPDAVRADFESRFGFDFSRVRVHGDSQSARSADELGASAYTTGRSIVFGRGQLDTLRPRRGGTCSRTSWPTSSSRSAVTWRRAFSVA